MRWLCKAHGCSVPGFSLFVLLDYTVTPIGRRCLRNWMRRPLQSLGEISKRQAAIEVLLQPENAAIVDQMTRVMRGIKDMNRYSVESSPVATSSCAA